MKLAMLPPTLLIYFLMMRPALSRSPYPDGGGGGGGGTSVSVGTGTAQRRHLSALSHLKDAKIQGPNGGLVKIDTNGVHSASKEDEEEQDEEDFEEPDLFDFPQFTKRQYDDYGHLRFGKRDSTSEDYGHMRFGKRNSFDDYGHMRFGKRNNNNGGSTDEDYGHLRFGRQAA